MFVISMFISKIYIEEQLYLNFSANFHINEMGAHDEFVILSPKYEITSGL